MAESIAGGGPDVMTPSIRDDLRAFTNIAAGLHATCGIAAAGRITCWGPREGVVARDDGQPLEGATAVAVGKGHACAGNATGVYCWGKNDQGQLARPLATGESLTAGLASPGGVRFLGAGVATLAHDGASRICGWGWNGEQLITAANDVAVYTSPVCSNLGDVAALAVGESHACARHADGRFSCWGERYYGQLGLGGADTSNIVPHGGATGLPGGTVSLTAGTSHTCALDPAGAVICFGRNHLGQIGPEPGTLEEEVRQPARVTGLPGRASLLASGSTAHHNCVVIADGESAGAVVCWGANDAGQLGDGAPRYDPTRASARPLLVRW